MSCYPTAGLILDIFAQRARTHEGKLQVELAQLRHLATRLVRGWTHLERQKGGIGLRGPVKPSSKPTVVCCVIASWQIQSRLERVEKQREQGRQSRIKADVPTVSLVGYTNAGKSTLSIASPKRGSTRQTSCLPPSTRRCGVLTLQMSVKPYLQIP
ncbi:hypothetical protein ACVXG9_02840 [Escherichia coli]